MATRRDFFRKFVNHIGVLHEDIKGRPRVALNQLRKLPKNITEQIEPVLFPQNDWQLAGNKINMRSNKKDEKQQITLNDIEYEIFQQFMESRKLIDITIKIKDIFNISKEEAFEEVTELFFNFAELRIVHPREVYDIEQIQKTRT